MERKFFIVIITFLIDLQLIVNAFDCTGKSGNFCDDSDCSLLQFCYVGSTPLFETSCPSIDSKKPYCNVNACSATPAPGCESTDPFICTAAGVFPDPDDCTIYHECPGAYEQATLISCPSTYRYISSKKTCIRGAACQKVDCSAKANKNKFIINTHDNAYYAFCYDGSMTVMSKCDDEINYIYDVASGECVFNCKAEGNHVDPTDCYSYISCYKVSGKYQTAKTRCPLGYIFDPVALICVSDKETPCTRDNDDEPGTDITRIPVPVDVNY